jgi:hypothetical protein
MNFRFSTRVLVDGEADQTFPANVMLLLLLLMMMMLLLLMMMLLLLLLMLLLLMMLMMMMMITLMMMIISALHAESFLIVSGGMFAAVSLGRNILVAGGCQGATNTKVRDVRRAFRRSRACRVTSSPQSVLLWSARDAAWGGVQVRHA